MTTLLQVAVLLVAVAVGPAAGASPEKDLRATVRSGIERALAAKSQDELQAAFDSILGLGCRAVPDIVDRMDDRRELPIKYLRLTNDSSQAFEAFRQYGPEVVTDALAAILNDITLADCGFIFNGASEPERRATVECWQKFVRETPVKSCGRK